jgi:hypothetical protein
LTGFEFLPLLSFKVVVTALVVVAIWRSSIPAQSLEAC